MRRGINKLKKIDSNTLCRLCKTEGKLFREIGRKTYFRCPNCKSIFLNPKNYITKIEEENRYREHNNNVSDPGYQAFVTPIVNAVVNSYDSNKIGLDYGSGTGPVISKLLSDKGYKINLFDPFFANDPSTLTIKYNFIVCCEVMEHFHWPYEEFSKLYALLLPGGTIFMKTNIYNEDINFDTWYYKNDSTHVFFYHKESLLWIKNHFKFSEIIIEENYFKFVL